jgi:ABC-type dipeptide/oligopeptide/nickel transport system permease subunit
VSVGDALSMGVEPTDAPVQAHIQGRSPFQLAFARIRRDRASVICLIVIGLIVLVAIFAPVFAAVTGHGANHQFRTADALSPSGQPVGPSRHFLLGTDDQGRDLLVRVAYGTRISLLVGVVATLLTVAVGVIAGMVAGYYGRIVDTLLARLIDVTLAIPFLLFAVALVSVVGHAGLSIVIIVIALFGWGAVGRIIRGQVLSIREREYIEAARSLGASDLRIIFIDILPNVLAQALVYASLLIPVSIVTEASLSFLGVGVPPPTSDWGQMISGGEAYYQSAWWYVLFPSLALLITTLAFNILGDGVRDAFDPRSDRLFAK